MTLAGVRQLQKRYHPLMHSTKAGMLHKQASIQLTIYQYQMLENIHLIERSEFYMEDQKMNLTLASVSLQLFTVRQHYLVPFPDTPRAHPTS